MGDTAVQMFFQATVITKLLYILPVHGGHGGALRRLTTVNISKVLLDVVLERVSVHQTSHRQLNSLLMLATNYFVFIASCRPTSLQ